MIEKTRLGDDVELRVREGAILIVPARRPRSGWRESAPILRQRNGDEMFDPPTATWFDEKDWEW